MEDNSGKKFSLQDWVMKRAANQSGAVVPSLSSRLETGEVESREDEVPIEVEIRAVSNGSTISSATTKDIIKEIGKEVSKEVSREDSQPEEALLSQKDDIKDIPSTLTSSQNPLQQLQIVRLLTDLGDRLRQSEKEREVLWKEIELCRKQIADMSGNTSKSEKSYANLESQVNQREVFVKELVEKQIGLEQQLKDQLTAFETSKQEQVKLQDKLVSVETATGSAIVRVEDVMSENLKLSKRVEQLGQDKARLVRKLEAMEETLTQTQDILKAKALVLLTDQAVAAKTALPQTPAWTGDDTLKVSTAIQHKSKMQTSAGPVGDIAASLRNNQQPSLLKVSLITALVASAAAFAVIWSIKSFDKSPITLVEKIENLKSDNANQQDQLMADAAKIASQIEPGTLDAPDEVLEPSDELKSINPLNDNDEFSPAQVAQNKAVDEFKAGRITTPVTSRIRRDMSLPKSVKDIEAEAFKGNIDAQHDLAAIYTAGHAGVKASYLKAAKWFEEAAQNGSANAQYNLGVLYHQGFGVQKNTAKAIQLYRVAASNKHPEALYNLAIAYVEGVGVEYNPQIAAVYFERAARGGVVEAAYNLGLLHENGLMGESQPDEAVFWYTLAADKNNTDAVKALEQLKIKLNISEGEASRIISKVAAGKAGFTGANGQPELPIISTASHVKAGQEQPAYEDKVPLSSMTNVDPVVVSQIQEQLMKLGLYKGIPNGTISPVLSQAIRTYQQKNSLKIDGQPSDDLLVQMLAANSVVGEEP